MAAAIQEGTATGVSDGSYATVHCTSAFIITHRRRGNTSNRFCNVKPHRLDDIPEAMDDYDCSMTPRALKPENTEADLALTPLFVNLAR